jgi:gliding motility-associated-like protein
VNELPLKFMSPKNRRFAYPIFLTFIFVISAGQNTTSAADLSSELSQRSGFFENKNAHGILDASAPFFFLSDGLRVYFTEEGLSYEARVSVKHKLDSVQQRSENGYKSHHKEKLHKVFQMRFLNAADHINFIEDEVQSGYLVQSDNIQSKRYAKLTLENVWENIDIEYTLNDRGGFNYAIILKAGSDLSDVQFDYSDAESITLNSFGLQVQSSLGAWLESAPLTFNEWGVPVNSTYVLFDQVVRFSISGYEKGTTYLIDPWITFYPSYQSYDELPSPMDSVWLGLGLLTGTGINNAFNRVQMDYDNAGNIYIARTPALFYNSEFGANGYYPAGRFVEKYDTNGDLVYIIDNGYEEGYFSDIAVNRINQEVYYTSMPSEINYANANGLLINTTVVADLPLDITEVCSIEYDHCTNRLILGFGGDFSDNPRFYGLTDASNNGILVTSDGFDISQSIAEYIPYNDNIDITIDPETGEYFYLFLLRNDFFLSDRTLLKANPTNLDPVVQNSGSFLNFEELAMHSSGELTFFRNHFDALKCGRNAIYGTNGGEMVRWDKETAELVNSIDLDPFLTMRAEGIDIDLCGNVYIGSNNRVSVYDPDLNFISNIQLEGMPQDLAVYGNKLYAASDFAIETIALPNELMPWTLTQQPDSCDACVGQASIEFCVGVPEGLEVEWVSTGATSLTATNLCSGWQSIIIKELKNCVVHEYTDSIFVATNEEAICQFQIGFEDLQICENECVLITSEVSGEEGEVTFEWNNGIITTSPELEICPESTATFQIIATDASGAIDTASFTITVSPFPLVHLGNDTTLCASSTLLLDAQNIGASYTWQNGSTGQTFLVDEPGSFFVETAFGICVVSDTIEVSYNNLDVDLGQDTAVCSFQGLLLNAGVPSFNYTWQDGSTFSTYEPESFGLYSVVVFDGLCTVSDSILFAQGSIAVDLGPDQTFCEGEELLLNSGLESGEHLWSDFSAGLSLIVGEPGAYYVEVTNGLCFSTDTVDIVLSNVTANLEMNTTDGCAPLEVLFTDLSSASAGSLASWEWSFGDGNTSNLNSPEHTYLNAGLYSVSLNVTNTAGCTDDVSFVNAINVHPTPNAEFTMDPSFPSINEPVQFTDLSSNALQWEWNFGDGGISAEQNPEYAFETSGVYTITLTINNESCIASNSFELMIDQPLEVYVPNSFSPNNDDLNEIFKPSFFGNDIAKYEFQIFNRWGEIVFQTNNPQTGWIGNVANDDDGGQHYSPDGVYVWKMVIDESNSTETKTLTGHVVLIR